MKFYYLKDDNIEKLESLNKNYLKEIENHKQDKEKLLKVIAEKNEELENNNQVHILSKNPNENKLSSQNEKNNNESENLGNSKQNELIIIRILQISLENKLIKEIIEKVKSENEEINKNPIFELQKKNEFYFEEFTLEKNKNEVLNIELEKIRKEYEIVLSKKIPNVEEYKEKLVLEALNKEKLKFEAEKTKILKIIQDRVEYVRNFL